MEMKVGKRIILKIDAYSKYWKGHPFLATILS